MSLIEGQILIRSGDFDRVTSLLTAYLEGWFRERYAGASPSERRSGESGLLLDGEGIRSLILLPPCEGWMTVLERVPGQVDLALARELSRAHASRVIATEVDGSRYRWARYAFEAGALISWVLEPPEVFEERYWAPIGARAHRDQLREMPLYRDAESEAAQELLAEGVPPDVLFLSHSRVSSGTAAASEACFFKIWDREDGPTFRHYTFRAAVEPAIVDSTPPLVFDRVELKTDVSQQRIRETRRVCGRPTEETTRRLGELEGRYRQRVFDRFSRECADEFLPEVSFAYEHATGDRTFPPLLRAAHAAQRRERPWLYHGAVFSRTGFRGLAARLAREMRPSRIILEGTGFELALPEPTGGSRRLELEGPYERYLAQPERVRALIRETLDAADTKE